MDLKYTLFGTLWKRHWVDVGKDCANKKGGVDPLARIAYDDIRICSTHRVAPSIELDLKNYRYSERPTK